MLRVARGVQPARFKRLPDVCGAFVLSVRFKRVASDPFGSLVFIERHRLSPIRFIPHMVHKNSTNHNDKTGRGRQCAPQLDPGRLKERATCGGRARFPHKVFQQQDRRAVERARTFHGFASIESSSLKQGDSRNAGSVMGYRNQLPNSTLIRDIVFSNCPTPASLEVQFAARRRKERYGW